MKAPLTDAGLSIPHTGQHDARFRDVRKKAKLEEEVRHQKFRRDKKKSVKLPKYKIGEEVVLAAGYQSRYYHLAEVIDFDERMGSFYYYGILKRTTEPEKFERIGRLVKFGEKSWFADYCPANVENKGIKWLVA